MIKQSVRALVLVRLSPRSTDAGIAFGRIRYHPVWLRKQQMDFN
jgi:hypothetical protein